MKKYALPIIIWMVTAVAAAQSVKLVDRSSENRLDLMIDGRLFTSLRWGGDFYRPALYPIMSANAHFVTRGFPFETRDGDTIDHPHQVGCWFAYANVDGIDFWNSSRFRTAKEMEKMGRVVHKRIVSKRILKKSVEIVIDADWIKPDGRIVFNERTKYTISANVAERRIDRDTTLTAVGDDAIFGDNKDGMFGLHVASELEQDDQKDVKVTSAAGVVSTGRPVELLSGQYWDSEGRRAEKDIWGTRGRWAAVSGNLGTEKVTVAIFDHPSNPLSPTRMMVRGYGLFAVNPFGQKQFDSSLEERKTVLKKGKSFRFRYRVLIAPTGKSMENEYRSFAAKTIK